MNLLTWLIRLVQEKWHSLTWQRQSGQSVSFDLDLNTLYTRFRDLPEPTVGEQRLVCKQFKRELESLLQTADEYQLKPDLFKLMLEALLREFQIPVETIKANFERMKGDWRLEAQERHWAIPLLTENLARYLNEEGGPNFAEMVLEMRVNGIRNPDVPGFTLTLQRLDGKAPSDLLAECKRELAALQEESRVWQESHAWLEGRNTSKLGLDDTNPYIGIDPKLADQWDDGWLSEVSEPLDDDDETGEVEDKANEMEKPAIANIYGQKEPRSIVYLVANLEALCRMANAVLFATVYKPPQHLMLQASDGEPFELVVVRSEELLSNDDLSLPYSAHEWQRRPSVENPSIHPYDLVRKTLT